MGWIQARPQALKTPVLPEGSGSLYTLLGGEVCSVSRDQLGQEVRERICRAEGKEQVEVSMEAAKEQPSNSTMKLRVAVARRQAEQG